MSNGYYTQLALSPDGRTLVFAANNLLWSRAFGEEVAIPLEGTDGGEQPFFSPRGDWIGFLQGGRLMRQRMADGSVTQLVEPSVGNINAGSWGADDSIILGMLTSGLGRIPVGGSDIETLATPIAEEGETAYVLPQSIDDGRAVLYTALGPSFLAKDSKVAVLDLTTGDRTVVVERATHGRYAPSGHVVYVDGAGTLMAVPFDLKRRESSPADAEPVETGIRVGFWAGAASFDVSAAGTLAFVRGSNWENQLLAVVDRGGNVLRHIGPPLTTDTVTLSRDGSTIAADVFHPDNADIYTYDVNTGNEVRFTEHDAMEENGIVSPNGDRVAFFRASAGNLGQILVQETGRGAQPEVVYEGSGYATPAVWSPDGEYLMIVGLDALAMSDVLAVNVGTKEVIEIATTDANETPGDFSRDGSYFAYDADDDVRVTPFPSLEGDFVVPDAAQPRWAGDELFFLRASTLMAMRITTDPSFRPLGDPQPLFELQTIPGSWTGSGRRASISPFPDGQRFLVDVTNPDTKARADEIWVILNWFEELKQRVPTGR